MILRPLQHVLPLSHFTNRTLNRKNPLKELLPIIQAP